MQFVHFVIMPFVIFIFSIVLHYWLDQKEFNQFLKIYFFGIAAGIIIAFVHSFFKFTFIYSANYISILIKSLFFDGIFVSLFMIFTLYIIFDKILGIQLTINWSLTSIMIFSFVSGIYSVINIREVFTNSYPESLFIYFSFFPYLFFITLVLGLGIPNYIDSYDLFNKVLWAAFTIGITVVVSMLYNFLRFYNFWEHYLIAVPFIVIAVFFEIIDFKDFRR
ncbi:MAG: hypothetical protein JXB50_01275 [Spirochaetes bacterium]|nr:hypothetical protein [Spirochaetota bacterium]